MKIYKESNSPFWLIGVGKNKTYNGDKTNVPCYSKTLKKQKEISQNIFKANDKVEKVYCLTGVQWDNMPSGNKEEFGYVVTKGKLILSKSDLNENDYPKGISREPLPKKGAKIITSVATALEDSDMTLKLTKSIDTDVQELTKDIVNFCMDLDWMDYYDSKDDAYDEIYYYLINGSKMILKILNEMLENTDDENRIVEIKSLINRVEKLTKNKYGEDKSMNTFDLKLKLTENDDEKKSVSKKPSTVDDAVVLDMLRAIALGDLGKAREIGEQAVGKEECENIVTESKIVEPVGKSQQAGSFVNIDIDLDHYEISDFIVRLSQAIRSEELAILEYTALLSANGVTNDDRSVIEAIIKEEKSHLAAITTCLYKQMLMNHSDSIDTAKMEFPALPKIDANYVKENNLTESIYTFSKKVTLCENQPIASLPLLYDLSLNIYEIDGDYATVGYNKDETQVCPIECDGEECYINFNDEKYNINDFMRTNFMEKTEIKNNANDMYEVIVDVNYDKDNTNKLITNIKNAIKQLNSETISMEDDIKLENDKFICKFTVSNNSDVDVIVNNYIVDLFEKASSGECIITLAK